MLAALWARQQAELRLVRIGWGVAGAAAGLGFAVLCAQVGFVRLGLALAILAILLGAAWVFGDRLLPLLRLSQAGLSGIQAAAARLAERLAPELGTAPTAAVDLERRLHDESLPFSRGLAEAHLERTAEALERVDLEARLRAVEHARKRRALTTAGAALFVFFLIFLVATEGRRRLIGFLRDPTAAELVDVPLAGDIHITYHFPAYTKLPPRLVEGGDGSIAAVVGTEVELSATADTEVETAVLKVDNLDGTPAQALPMQVQGERGISARFTLSQDGRYHFALETEDGERLEERQKHSIRAVPDAFPTIEMVMPPTDVELRDNQTIDLEYAAEDDYGVAEISLVLEVSGETAPRRVKVSSGGEAQHKGSHRWAVAELELPAGAEGRFFLEVVDNDAITGPKKAQSASRRISLFSAKKHHDDLLGRQQKILEGLVDWLGNDLTQRFVTGDFMGLEKQKKLVERISGLGVELASLVPLLREDKLVQEGVATAFGNIWEHVQAAEQKRRTLINRVAHAQDKKTLYAQLEREQERAIGQLEKDVIYLDDLLAVERIDELKRTAKDLLAAQRELSDLLEKYKQTQDPALKAMLEQRIRALKDQMMQLLARMAQIKQALPGEYRNMEAAAQLQVGDQLERLEDALKNGDLESAAKELEQLANMIEDMSSRLDDAEEEYGGERYEELRQQLADFAQEFKQLEGEQEALAKRAEELTKQYRQKAISEAGKDLDDLVKKARQKTAEALQHLDEVGELPLYGVAESLQSARQRLMDLDGLLAQKDFAEARRTVDDALSQEETLELSLEAQALRAGQKGGAEGVKEGQEHADRAHKKTGDVKEMLDKLFPDPQDVLSREQMQQMKNLGKKQGELEQQAQRLGQKMEQLAQEVPLFGGEPKGALEGARGEMGQAQGDLRDGELPGGSQHGRRAADQLAKLRQALEQASQGGGKGGLPLPLGMGGQGRGEGGGEINPREDVRIPDADKNRAAPRFRKELMEAAKQKAPPSYEDAVRKYYEELIR